MILLSETFIYLDGKNFNDLSNEYKIIQLVNYICSEKNFQWKKKGFLMVHMAWRWDNSFRPCCGVAKSVHNFDARCNHTLKPWFFFRLFISNCLNWKIYCDDHTSLSSTTAVQIWINSYIFHMISLRGKIWTQYIDLAPNVWLHSSVGRASHRYRGGHGFESRWSPGFFSGFFFPIA